MTLFRVYLIGVAATSLLFATWAGYDEGRGHPWNVFDDREEAGVPFGMCVCGVLFWPVALPLIGLVKAGEYLYAHANKLGASRRERDAEIAEHREEVDRLLGKRDE